MRHWAGVGIVLSLSFAVQCQSSTTGTSTRYPTTDRPIGTACEHDDYEPASSPRGPRDEAQVFAELDDVGLDLRDCVQDGIFTVNPFMHGAVCLRLEIAADGGVTTAWIDGSELPESSVHRCMLRVLCDLRFGSASTGDFVSYRMVFYRREVDPEPTDYNFDDVCG